MPKKKIINEKETQKQKDNNDLDEFISKHPYRKFCFEKFEQLLLNFNWTNLSNYIIIKKAINIERAIFNFVITYYTQNIESDSKIVWNPTFEFFYKDHFRHIYVNLLPEGKGSIKNSGLLTRYLDNQFNEKELVSMKPEDMHPEFWFDLQIQFPKNDELNKMIEFKKQKTETQGILKCGKCKTYRTSYVLIQTRSGDEGSTQLISCDCGNKWKMS